jgi:glycerol kinase
VLEVMRSRFSDADEAPPATSLRVDGGAAANDWLMQFQADVLGIAIERPQSVETTARGAAILAGISAGVWKDPDQALDAISFTRFEPGTDSAARTCAEEGYAAWQRAVRTSLFWARNH